jgi:hypothetical protein
MMRHTQHRRGRPRLHRPSSDTGTPELVYKRACGVTTESLDLCLERELITSEQHWCGIHLRWLYTLRYGAPGVRAIDPTHLGGVDIPKDDPTWRALREAEYHHAILTLGSRLAACVIGVVVYNERPAFLLPLSHMPSPGMARLREAQLEQLREGLELLAKHWRRPEKKRPAR